MEGFRPLIEDFPDNLKNNNDVLSLMETTVNGKKFSDNSGRDYFRTYLTNKSGNIQEIRVAIGVNQGHVGEIITITEVD